MTEIDCSEGSYQLLSQGYYGQEPSLIGYSDKEGTFTDRFGNPAFNISGLQLTSITHTTVVGEIFQDGKQWQVRDEQGNCLYLIRQV
ncbi:hypothetical protein IFT80_02370 [Pseudomonas sp. CFBP 8771]|uniref:hypothetical protein n=1 Tax=Pseudomonas sp. CFBP 8771 TaxID=2775285 RepID=UPI001781570B|nr:hypothetical protein [Pseudomonas sp. CFBP 8771]MBD8601481.1 hypothetical protein [Pseudomonas sp. CFBP 8771]